MHVIVNENAINREKNSRQVQKLITNKFSAPDTFSDISFCEHIYECYCMLGLSSKSL